MRLSRRWRFWLGVAGDVAAISALLIVGLLFWPRFAGAPASSTFGEPPFWATIHDMMLMGPDAGEWASGALKVRFGEFDQLDVHRMPTWLLLVGAMLFVQPDPALAGHLVNHLLQLLMPIVIYGLGRMGGGRAVGLGAGMICATCASLIESSRGFGVDPAVAFLLPAALLAALTTRWRWWLAAPAGVLAALAASTHFTTLPFVAPPAVAVLLRGPRGWRRFAAFGLQIGATALALLLIFQLFPFPPKRVLVNAVSEGIAPTSVDSSAKELALSDKAMEILEAGQGQALNDAVNNVLLAIRPAWIPWHLALVLPWIGVIGAGLTYRRKRPEGVGPPARWRRILGAQDLGLGIPLLLCLAPLPVLAAADAPLRYGANLLPFAALLLVRGLVSPLALLDTGVRRLWAPWPRGLIAGAVAVAIAVSAWQIAEPRRRILPPIDQGLASRRLGQALIENFPARGGAVCQDREAAAIAGRSFCPQSSCPHTATEAAYRRCLGILLEECRGEGPIPYVVLVDADRYPSDAAHQGMDEWVRERWETVSSVHTTRYLAHVVSIPRDEARELDLTTPNRGIGPELRPVSQVPAGVTTADEPAADSAPDGG